MKKKFRGILAVVVAGIMMLAMAVTVAAQEPSAEESQPAAAAEPAVQEPSAEEPSVEPNPEPTLPTSAPEASETPEPTPSAAESNAPEPSLPTENVPAETAQPEPEEPPAERQPDVPAPQDERRRLLLRKAAGMKHRAMTFPPFFSRIFPQRGMTIRWHLRKSSWRRSKKTCRPASALTAGRSSSKHTLSWAG